MKEEGGIMGSGGGFVEVDETSFGGGKEARKLSDYKLRHKVVGLVDR